MQPIEEKQSVRQFWDAAPCGTRDLKIEPGTREYFDTLTANRYRIEYFIPGFARFNEWKGKQVLEVGCGAGTDLLSFATRGALVTGLDLSPHSADLACRRLRLYGCEGNIINSDAENLPFKENSFDLAYSWGVLHHTPDTKKSIREIYRVVKPGGSICVMLYNRHSLVALQLYAVYGLLALKPGRSLEYIFAHYHESPGTRAYSKAEIKNMFEMFKNLDIQVQLTDYDLRFARERYLPRWIGKLVPQGLGFFIVIRGQKAQAA